MSHWFIQGNRISIIVSLRGGLQPDGAISQLLSGWLQAGKAPALAMTHSFFLFNHSNAITLMVYAISLSQVLYLNIDKQYQYWKN